MTPRVRVTDVPFIRHQLRRAFDPKLVRQRALVRRGMSLPQMGDVEGVWGVAMVKNEADIIGQVVRHLLSQGLAQVLIVDNGSTDGTASVLTALAASDPRVQLGADYEPGYYQAAKMTFLADLARRRGASWVIPFDADEFWFAKDDDLAGALGQASADVLTATIHNVFPTLDGEGWRMDRTVHRLGKVAFRPHPLASVGMGNHYVVRPGVTEAGLHVAHYPWRSFHQFQRKVRQGAAAFAAAELNQGHGEHWRVLGAMTENDLRQAWRAILDGGGPASLGWRPVGPFEVCDPRSWLMWPRD